MERYFFTFIIFNDKLEKLEQTLESICQGLERKRVNMQIIIVDDTGTAMENQFQDRLKQSGVKLDYLAVTEENREGILEQALAAADGTYVNITKSGVLYQDDTIYKIYRYADKSKEDRILVPAVTGRNSAIMKEVNAFRKKYGTQTNLENNYHIIHCNYFSYFIRKEAFSKEPCPDKSWTLAILKKIFYTVTPHASLGFAKKAKIRLLSGAEVMAPWSEMLKEDCSTFCKSFLSEIFEFCKRQEAICEKNAKYNLIYYCSRIIALYEPEEHMPEIRSLTEAIMEYIKDDEILLFNQYLGREYKFYLENRFHWENDDNPEVAERRREILDQSYAGTTYQFLEVEKEKIVLECRAAMFMQEEFQVYFKVNDKLYEGIPQEKEAAKEWFGEKICQLNYVKGEIPLSRTQEYRVKVICAADGEQIERNTYNFGKFMPLANDVELYYQSNGWNVFFDRDTQELVFAPEKKSQNIRLRWRRMISLLKENNAARKAVIVRLMLGIFKAFKKEEIWLISDRTNRGDDNGEIFFKYVCEQKLPGIKPYFVISKDVPDFERMKQYGEVVPVYSWKHKMLHLMSDYIISSQANKPVINPFGAVGKYYKEIIAREKIVFLQHGVIKDDLSGWLNRYNRNLYGFVVTTRPEYDSILDYEYYYTPREVWLTGLPRHDALIHDEKKCITIMPTWRKTLTGGTDAAGVWKIGDDFAESGYFKFYNELLNHERLLAEVKKHGYQLCFMPHPNVKPALGLFKHHPDVIFWDETKAYREVFAESNLLVTDYSSVVFDFAYLRKPILYCQFDREEFFSGGHSYVEGYYNYLEDGFGEVEEDLEGIVERIIEYVRNGCVLKEKYAERIDRTFAYHDKECCRRVVDKIQGKTISDIRET